MRFEWDAAKAARNLARHGVSFDEATTVFGDPLHASIQDPDHSLGERRLVTIGMTIRGRLAVVAHTEAGEVVRIISAREATAPERKRYESA